MVRLSATEVARSFSAIVNRVGGGEEIEVVRNGVPVVEMRPARSGASISADRWREMIASAPPVDDEFASDVERARSEVGAPSGVWPS